MLPLTLERNTTVGPQYRQGQDAQQLKKTVEVGRLKSQKSQMPHYTPINLSKKSESGDEAAHLDRVNEMPVAKTVSEPNSPVEKASSHIYSNSPFID